MPGVVGLLFQACSLAKLPRVAPFVHCEISALLLVLNFSVLQASRSGLSRVSLLGAARRTSAFGRHESSERTGCARAAPPSLTPWARPFRRCSALPRVAVVVGSGSWVASVRVKVTWRRILGRRRCRCGKETWLKTSGPSWKTTKPLHLTAGSPIKIKQGIAGRTILVTNWDEQREEGTFPGKI
ncbi:uncharacterized protein LOC123019412 isoform X1 [Varanus komodoensis]|uniref:uncharacterized protein LOC123019412 isoform X1 n=1 Tax=Varanus komodoensis TaxID=61221 RepID=UPI001CF7CDFC|nr:uncharacterized protein LOC123019412 isoform X1 [Varanus komodoensis]